MELVWPLLSLESLDYFGLQATGNFFGDTIWVIITVEPAGTMAITQQFQRMDNLGEINVDVDIDVDVYVDGQPR